jgi:hypothetical protein
MKRLIAAAALAAVAGSVFAVEIGKPYEELDIERRLPNIPERATSATAYPFNGSAPYDQIAVDRALPNVAVAEERTRFAATAGETRSDASPDVAESRPAVSPFAHQHDVIAPAP